MEPATTAAVAPRSSTPRSTDLPSMPSSMPSSSLTDELAKRLELHDEAHPNDAPDQPTKLVSVRLFCNPGHQADLFETERPSQLAGIVSKWRQKERLKTTAVSLVLCLNIGVDPPDVIRISPCARLECWVDPLSMQPPKALETIGKNLQAQYERWQPRAKYKTHLDPTVDDVKKLAISCRKSARNERVLFHYNGHGVPRPTANGEIWVFNKNYTQYIPLSLYDLQSWVGTPAIHVFDCSAAGLIVNSFKSFAAQRMQEMEAPLRSSTLGAFNAGLTPPPRNPMADTILLAACSANELLPQNPELPADVFTACLTTPIKVALRWFCSRSLLRHEWLHKECIDRIPGKQTDRKTPLGELNWIFTAITDTIAWNMLPRPLFQKLFRQDLLVASLFRNYLLAERIMRAANCTPVSYPRLPPTHQHPMWQAWDYAAEMCLLQLPGLMNGENVEFQPSTFFSEQLTAFELWLEHGSSDMKPPEQLPIVLQVLLSQVHRLRALVLLGRFLDMGSWAVDLALSVGIFPYVLKLLQTTAVDLRQTLVFIWTKILALDKSCQVDLVKDNGHLYFIRHLDSPPDALVPASSKAQAAFVLAVICDDHPRGQRLCAEAGLLRVCLQQLPGAQRLAVGVGGDALLLKWLLLVIGKLCENNVENTTAALLDHLPDELARFLIHPDFEVRAAAVFALGALVQAYELPPPPDLAATQQLASGGPSSGAPGDSSPSSSHSATTGGPPDVSAQGGAFGHVSVLPPAERSALERTIACHLLNVVYDGSPLVRAEVGVALARMASGHSVLWTDAIYMAQKNAAAILKAGSVMRTSSRDSNAHSAPTAPSYMQTSPFMNTSTNTNGPRPTSIDLPHDRGNSGKRSSGGGTTGGGGGAGNGTPPSGDLLPPSQCPLNRHGSHSQPVSPINSPGVRPVATLPGGYHAVLGATGPLVGSVGAPMVDDGTAAAHAAAVFASADAARVGGGVYTMLLDAACTLATDPAPNVAAQGAAALAVSSVELVPLRHHGAMLQHAMSSMAALGGGVPVPGMAAQASMAFSSALSVASGSFLGNNTASSPATASLGSSLASKLNGKLFRGASLSSGPKLGAGGGAGGAGAQGGALSASAMAMRPPYILQRVREASGQGVGPEGQLSNAEAGPMAPLSGRSSDSGHSTHGAQEPLGVHLPCSVAYRALCEHFSWPLLSQGGDGVGGGPPHGVWSAPDDPVLMADRKAKHQRYIDTLHNITTTCSMRKDVQSINLDCGSISRIVFDPMGGCFAAADGGGTLRIYKHSGVGGNGLINRFHVAQGVMKTTTRIDPTPPPAPVGIVHLSLLNELSQQPLLLAGSADGAVRVWRGYHSASSTRLATAWQSVPVAHGTSPQGAASSVFCLDAVGGGLFAVGGSQPGVVQRWSLEQEMRSMEIHVQPPSGASATQTYPSSHVEHLCTMQGAPLLFAGCRDGLVLLYDLRAPQQAVQSLRPFHSSLAGMVVEPGATPHSIAVASPKGLLKFCDTRMPGPTSAPTPGAPPVGSTHHMGVWKTVEAHTKGTVTALAAHPNAPLLATATSMQAVKLWSPRGEQLGVVRTTASLLQRIGAVNCLTFHPLKLMLAGGAGDGVVALYNIHDGSGGGSGVAGGGGGGAPSLAMDSVGSSVGGGASPLSAASVASEVGSVGGGGGRVPPSSSMGRTSR